MCNYHTHNMVKSVKSFNETAHLRYPLKWKDTQNRKPVILEGIRQCGKTWILKDLGEKEFKDIAYFNFESDDRLQKIFEGDLNVL